MQGPPGIPGPTGATGATGATGPGGLIATSENSFFESRFLEGRVVLGRSSVALRAAEDLEEDYSFPIESACIGNSPNILLDNNRISLTPGQRFLVIAIVDIETSVMAPITYELNEKPIYTARPLRSEFTGQVTSSFIVNTPAGSASSLRVVHESEQDLKLFGISFSIIRLS